MKYFMIVFSLYFSAFSLNLIPQEKEIREDIVVTNVEIPVRVLHKGIAIDNLKKEDFQLYENGSLIPIHGLNIIRKQLIAMVFISLSFLIHSLRNLYLL